MCDVNMDSLFYFIALHSSGIVLKQMKCMKFLPCWVLVCLVIQLLSCCCKSTGFLKKSIQSESSVDANEIE